MEVAILSFEVWNHPRSIKIARALLKKGYKVKFWGVRVPDYSKLNKLKKLFVYALSATEIALINADLYWVENVPDIPYIVLPLLRRCYVYDRRSPWSKHLKFEFKGSLGMLLSKLAEIIERYLIKHSRLIVTVSTPMKLEFNYKSVRKDCIVIPNYPEISFIRSGERNLRKELDLDPSVKVFTYIGKLSKIEGVDILPRIAKRLKGLNAELWVVGDGSLRHVIKDMCKKYNYVRWFGWVNRAEVPDYIRASNYGLVPRHETEVSVFYTHEGIHKICEFLAFNKPVIACGVAPSPYYLAVSEDDFPKTVELVAKGIIEPPRPKERLIWEEECEEKVVNVIHRILRGHE